MKILTCKDVKKIYKGGQEPAVRALNLEIEENTIFGYLGPNGAGKTTTIKIMTGLMVPTEGGVWIGDEKVGLNTLRLRSSIGYLSQEPKYYPWMTGRELLHFVGDMFGLAKRENKRRCGELLELANLTKAADRKIRGYSGGMVQRLGIAQALVGRPRILFLDEPVSALDPIGRKEVLEFIANLKSETTVFMSTHILEDVERVCDRVGILNKGKVIVEEDMETLKRQYAPPRVELSFENPEDRARFAELGGKYAWGKELVEEKEFFILKPDNFTSSRPEILGVIAKEKLALARMEVKSATLEDVFVRMIHDDNTQLNEEAVS